LFFKPKKKLIMDPIKLLLTFTGTVFAIAAIFCAQVTFYEPKDRKFFGIPIGLIGAIGYAVTGIASILNLYVYYPLVVIILVVTLLLIFKSIRLRRTCMFCVACWIINVCICGEAYVSITSSPKETTQNYLGCFYFPSFILKSVQIYLF
jgi:uncharacterized membrane protein